MNHNPRQIPPRFVRLPRGIIAQLAWKHCATKDAEGNPVACKHRGKITRIIQLPTKHDRFGCIVEELPAVVVGYRCVDCGGYTDRIQPVTAVAS